MDKYEVVIRNKSIGNRWTMILRANSFGHAEQQAIDVLRYSETNPANPTDLEYEEIIRIDKEYG